jgi:hypothetical protein
MIPTDHGNQESNVKVIQVCDAPARLGKHYMPRRDRIEEGNGL